MEWFLSFSLMIDILEAPKGRGTSGSSARIRVLPRKLWSMEG